MKIALMTLLLSGAASASAQSIYCYQSDNQFLIEIELDKAEKKAQVDFKYPDQEQYVDRDVSIDSKNQLAVIDISISSENESLTLPLEMTTELAESVLVKNGRTYPILCKLQ